MAAHPRVRVAEDFSPNIQTALDAAKAAIYNDGGSGGDAPSE